MRRPTDTDFWTLARTLYGECRGESREGKIAVASVIVNRAQTHYRGDTIYEVCMSPYQFSCWNPTDPNSRRLAMLTISEDQEWPAMLRCMEVAAAVIAGDEPDNTQGSRHYCRHDINPSWAEGHQPIVSIGAHKFYNDVR